MASTLPEKDRALVKEFPKLRKRGKRYRQAVMTLREKLASEEDCLKLPEAIELIKALPSTKFDEGIRLSFKTTLNPKNSALMVRGAFALPNGLGRGVRVAVFARGDDAKAAEEAGADRTDYDKLMSELGAGKIDFEAAIATPDAMKDLKKFGRLLGPRGMMPNPKLGTVTNEIAKAVKLVKAGRVEYKLDRGGNIAFGVGKKSFSTEQILENVKTAIAEILKARPAAAKGEYIANLTISSTHSPGVRVDESEYRI